MSRSDRAGSRGHDPAPGELARLRVIQSVTDTALSQLELDEILSQLLARAREALGADEATVLLLTPDGRELVPRASCGLEEGVVLGIHVPVGNGFVGRIVASRETIILPDVSQIDTVCPLLHQRLSSAMGTPLLVGGQPTGVLHVGSVAPRRFTVEDAQLLELVAERAAIPIERARLLEETRQARTRAEEERDRLRRTQSELAQRAAELDTAVSETRQMKERLEVLVQTLSHDLRTPLSAILLQAHLLGQAPELARRSAEIIRSAGNSMKSMIDELVELTRLETGQQILRLQPITVGAFLATLVRTHEGTLPFDRVKIVVAPGLPIVQADPERLERMLLNLLSNALKYAPGEGDVVLRAEQGEGRVTLSVTDRGPGIPPADLERIFERFYRVRRSAGSDGLGLGLYITRLLAQAHGGSVSAESRPGETVFRLTLPCAGCQAGS